MDFKKYLNIKTIVAIVIGGIAGFSYYHFIGCSSGSCPITGNPYISTAYGAMMGFIFALPSKKKKEISDEKNSEA